VSLSISVMLADTVISILIESLFLLQGKVISMMPIEVVGYGCNLVHQCLLHALYSFEYKWFSQGLELHKRLDNIERNWPYFLGFGLPLAVLTNIPTSQIVAGCVFSIAFPLFIVAGQFLYKLTYSLLTIL
jgi:etoposide-induced 2.4 mRNA